LNTKENTPKPQLSRAGRLVFGFMAFTCMSLLVTGVQWTLIAHQYIWASSAYVTFVAFNLAVAAKREFDEFTLFVVWAGPATMAAILSISLIQLIFRRKSTGP